MTAKMSMSARGFRDLPASFITATIATRVKGPLLKRWNSGRLKTKSGHFMTAFTVPAGN